MRIKEIVNKNLIIGKKDDSIYEIASKMKKYNIGFLPVFNEAKLLGVITDRDIVINCITNKAKYDDKIEGYINKNIISIDWNKEISEALNQMAKNKVKRLIVSNNEKIVGIISLSDILSTNLDEKILETIKSIWCIKDNKKEKDAEIDEFYL